jgi:hypothetical protein
MKCFTSCPPFQKVDDAVLTHKGDNWGNCCSRISNTSSRRMQHHSCVHPPQHAVHRAHRDARGGTHADADPLLLCHRARRRRHEKRKYLHVDFPPFSFAARIANPSAHVCCHRTGHGRKSRRSTTAPCWTCHSGHRRCTGRTSSLAKCRSAHCSQSR